MDEANLPPMACIECVRDLHDATDAPFLVIGHEGIVMRLRKLGPFFDRLLYLTEFKALSAADLKQYAKACLELAIDEAVLEAVVRLTDGNFRKAVVALRGMESRARVNRAAVIGIEHLARRAA